jgi:predicted Fe-Mo cluster-binding NifX family protein
MKVAIPMAEGKLAMHFGHCREFFIGEIDKQSGTITAQQTVVPPPHEPGVLPRWLAQQGVTTIIAGGMGQRAQMLFGEAHIDVVVGAPAQEPSKLIADLCNGTLVSGENACDH